MGSKCGKDPEPNQQEVLNFVAILCRDNNLRMVKKEVKYFPETQKFALIVQNTKTGECLLYELFQENSFTADRIRQKLLLKGPHFQRLKYYYFNKKVHCFGYCYAKNVTTALNDCNFLLARQRELFLRRVIPTVLHAIQELNSKGLCHQRLGWDNVEMQSNGKAKIRSLEYVVPSRNLSYDRLASVKHLPPEVLNRCCKCRKPNLDKVHIWILGSRLLEIFIRKYIAGPTFQKPPHNLGKCQALRNIKSNHPHLPAILFATTLTSGTQQLIQQMLRYKPVERLSLEEALAYYYPHEGDQSYSSIPGEGSKCAHQTCVNVDVTSTCSGSCV